MKALFTPLYLVGMWIYTALVGIASLFNKKASQLTKGRRNTWELLKNYDNSTPCVWVHAASLGEFEQGRPLIEAIKEHRPDCKVVLTFYSPSGYEVRKKYDKADLVCYLPADGPCNAQKFIEAINPQEVFFVKYEFWHFFLSALRHKGIRTTGISMIFRPEQAFFRAWGGWFRSMLKKFDHMYVQDQSSADLLESIGIGSYTVAGDTRFDRVRQIAEKSADIELCQRFVSNAEVTIVAGSTWEPDEERLLPYVNDPANNVKLIIASHEVHKERIDALCQKLTVAHCKYTDNPSEPEQCKVMVINTIGMLSAIYKYGQIAYIGGGFGKGIHNTLEAATYGMPVIFGPNHKKFKEACDLLECGAGFTYNTAEELKSIIDSLRTDTAKMAKAKKEADEYVRSMCGATSKVMHDVFGIDC